jgi:hypothetical protein
MSKMKEPEIAVATTSSSLEAELYSKLKEQEARGYWFRIRFPYVARTWQSVDEMASDMGRHGREWAERIETFPIA